MSRNLSLKVRLTGLALVFRFGLSQRVFSSERKVAGLGGGEIVQYKQSRSPGDQLRGEITVVAGFALP